MEQETRIAVVGIIVEDKGDQREGDVFEERAVGRNYDRKNQDPRRTGP